MIESIIHWIVEVVKALGYPGVFIMSALESTFLPIPSEVTLIPAGYLIHQGVWNGPLVFLLAVAGTMAGSLANYFIAYYGGRYVLVRYGKYFFISEEKLIKMEKYFKEHGPASIFLGRLLFGVRHFISFPAGLAKMDLKIFSIYTALGGSIWTLVLLVFGYFLGENNELVMSMMPVIKVAFVIGVGAVGYLYWKKHKKKSVVAPDL